MSNSVCGTDNLTSGRAQIAGLVEAHRHAVEAVCRSILQDEELVQEAFQMTFLTAMESFHQYRGVAPVRSWLVGIARNRSVDLLRRLVRDQRRSGGSSDLLTEASEDPRRGIERRLWLMDLAGPLGDCLQKLPPELRTAVLMRCAEGMSFLDMAPVLGARPATLQARVSRALHLLRRCMAFKLRIQKHS